MPEVRIYSKLCNSVFGLVDISICEQTYIEIYIRHKSRYSLQCSYNIRRLEFEVSLIPLLQP